MRKFYIIETEWGTDGETVDLPTAFHVTIDVPGPDDEDELLDMAVDALSDEYGWAILGTNVYDLDCDTVPDKYNDAKLPFLSEIIVDGEYYGWDFCEAGCVKSLPNGGAAYDECEPN